MYMDSSYLASITVNKLRRVRIFGFLVETLSPNPQCMRTLIPIWVGGLIGPHKRTGFIKADIFI
jgi:hypothetical protein